MTDESPVAHVARLTGTDHGEARAALLATGGDVDAAVAALDGWPWP